MKLKSEFVGALAACHLVAALALLPWFFSWTAVAMFAAGLFLFGVVGVNLCLHRLLTHRSFSCPLWLERVLVTLAACSAQDSPPNWVAAHRRHHQYTDTERDPHSPLAGFFWAHVGWLLVRIDDMRSGPLIERYAKDIMRDPYCAWLERRNNWGKLVLLSWTAYFAVGYGVVTLSGGTALEATQFGLSLFVWGAILRTVVMWHLTWSINSVTHIWGYRNYETSDVSRNNMVMGFLGWGEGWHNNHHADPRSARHGHTWWEFDATWMVIRFLMLLGLAKDVALPSPTLMVKRNGAAPMAPAPPALRESDIVSALASSAEKNSCSLAAEQR